MNDGMLIRQLTQDFGGRGLDLADPKHASQLQKDLETHEGRACRVTLNPGTL
jgi:hypothetical protein